MISYRHITIFKRKRKRRIIVYGSVTRYGPPVASAELFKQNNCSKSNLNISSVDKFRRTFSRDSGVELAEHFSSNSNCNFSPVAQAPCPDVYRGKYREIDHPDDDLGERYADDVRIICQNLKNKGKGVCAFIAESLMSVGGQILPPQSYFRNAYRCVYVTSRAWEETRLAVVG